MKAISDIIAILLMLIITIGLAGLAYSYISGIFSSRTGVQLSLSNYECKADSIYFEVRNDGTTASSVVTITVLNSTGGNALSGSCSIASVPAMSVNSTSCSRVQGQPAGGYQVRLTTPGAPSFSTTIYCVAS